MPKKLNGSTKLPKRANITVDLDGFDLEMEQGFNTGVLLVTLEFIKGGKKVYVHVDIFQHRLKPNPTLRMVSVNRTKDQYCTVQVRPWAKDDE
jgi:hypothetical protein